MTCKKIYFVTEWRIYGAAEGVEGARLGYP